MKRLFLVPLALAACLLPGCTGAPYPADAPVAVVTRDQEPSLSADALILASRAAATPWIPLDLARTIDRDLATIRERFASVRAIHARDRFEPRALRVAVTDGAPWVGRWLSGQLVTGQGALDRILAQHQASGVQILHRAPNRTTVFKVTFAPRLNLAALAPKVTGADRFVAWAEVNRLIGDGDDIEYRPREASAVGSTANRYAFSRGWGDCPAGCTFRHVYTVTLGDGSLQIVESGPPLPAEAAP